MTASEQKWAERIEGWRESGLTSEQFSKGREFRASVLRNWAYKLGRTTRRRPRDETPELRIVRVVRRTVETPTTAGPPMPTKARAPVLATSAVAAPASAPAPATTASAHSNGDSSLGIDVGAVHVVVRPGFDRGTLVALLDVLAVQGGGR